MFFCVYVPYEHERVSMSVCLFVSLSLSLSLSVYSSVPMVMYFVFCSLLLTICTY